MYELFVIFKGDSSSHLISDPQIFHCVSIKALVDTAWIKLLLFWTLCPLYNIIHTVYINLIHPAVTYNIFLRLENKLACQAHERKCIDQLFVWCYKIKSTYRELLRLVLLTELLPTYTAFPAYICINLIQFILTNENACDKSIYISIWICKYTTRMHTRRYRWVQEIAACCTLL